MGLGEEGVEETWARSGPGVGAVGRGCHKGMCGEQDVEWVVAEVYISKNKGGRGRMRKVERDQYGRGACGAAGDR